jgi:hypothetical protein
MREPPSIRRSEERADSATLAAADEIGRPRTRWGALKHLHWFEVVLAVWSLALAGWQLTKVDPQLSQFVAMWLIPPFYAIYVQLRGRPSAFMRGWSAIYLIALSVGDIIASDPHWLAHIKAIHPADTPFAVRWNQLDVVSRRVFAWNMVLAGSSLFCLMGYSFGWRNAYDRIRYGRAELSLFTSVLALLTLWVLPGVVLTWFLIDTLTPP